MDSVVRIQEIEVENFKNVLNGVITFESYKKRNFFQDSHNSDIVGLYGQNGSGKTSLVEAIDILKSVLLGQKLSNNIRNLISYDKKYCRLKFTFLIKLDKKKYIVKYGFKLIYNAEEDKIEVLEETLKYSEIDVANKKILSTKSIIEFNMNDKTIFKPLKNYNLIVNNNVNRTELIVAKELAKENSTSFIFSKRCIKLFKESFKNENKVFIDIINSLYNFGLKSFVIKNDYLGHIDLGTIMPFSFSVKNEKGVAQGTMAFSLFETNRVPINIFNILDKIIIQINTVLSSLIPGLTIKIKEINEELMENGNVGKVFELLSVRENVKIPLKYESDGIKKIISILSALIAMYNNENICIVIDEMDSGIFEFLLGELLRVLKEKAEGQLIFTSHNLRALEVLDKNDIIFTTTNPNNRYIKMKNVKKTNNLRDFYLREIFLGNQKEPIYNKTKSYVISRAFRKAGNYEQE
ncbi:MAG: AAA family ATPase [Clostridium sp.]